MINTIICDINIIKCDILLIRDIISKKKKKYVYVLI